MTLAHSKLGASSMYRWSACPGSLHEIARTNLPVTSSSYAEEGTDAHAFAAVVLKLDLDASTALGLTATIDGRKVAVGIEMADAVQIYADAVRKDMAGGAVLHVEQRFDLSEVYPNCFGTADAVVWQPEAQLLIVSDLKYGAGIPVEVTNNPQLMYYGLGALLALNYPAKRVRLQIIQPRCSHPAGVVRAWEIDAVDLIDFRGGLVAYAKATEPKDAPLRAGDHCRFCPAAPECSEIARHRNAVAAMDFASAPSIAPERLALALDSLPVLEAFIKRVRELAYAEAQAGRCPPGWKIVAKLGRRAWLNVGDVVKHMTERGVGADDIYEERKLKSPAQMEKLAGKGALDKFITTPSSGHALVPESDKRLPVRPDAAIEFASASD